MKQGFYALLILLFSLPLTAQENPLHLDSKKEIHRRVLAFAGKDADREATLRRFFEDSGCRKLSEQPVPEAGLPNLVCRLAGDTPQVILVGAHYDHVERGEGVLDNWSGASLLPALYDSLASAPRHHTFIFVAFSGEEKGLPGSQSYLQQISAGDKQRIAAMVNLDTLGITSTKVWASRADPALLSALETVAAKLKLPVSTVNVDNVGTTDSESFRRQNVPSITVHSVTPETFRFLHTAGDNRHHLNFRNYYNSYHLLAAYLTCLDRILPTAKQ